VKISQVVYLTQTPFSIRDCERFGVDIFFKHGIDVRVLDVTSYLDKYVANNYISEESKFSYVEKFDSFVKIKKYILETPENTVFISFIGESDMKSLKILNLLSKNNKEFGIALTGSLPRLSKKSNILTRIKLLNIKTIKRLLFKAFYVFFFSKWKYTFVIASGEESFEIIKQKYEGSYVIKGHAFDYDLYLDNKEDTNIENKDYAVFLDEFFPFHPDYMRSGIDYSGFADEYYVKLSNVFSYIEKTFDLEVIIAAHPRSNYENLPNYWDGRKFIKGNTINLVKNSKMCLLHASTSINFAVLYNIPTIFITMSEVKKSNLEAVLEAMATELDSKIVDLDSSYNIDEINYNKVRYKKYVNKYIKSTKSINLNNWELLYNSYMNK
jgi:hypothetical protein